MWFRVLAGGYSKLRTCSDVRAMFKFSREDGAEILESNDRMADGSYAGLADRDKFILLSVAVAKPDLR